MLLLSFHCIFSHFCAAAIFFIPFYFILFLALQSTVSSICHALHIPFFGGSVHGMHAFVMSDVDGRRFLDDSKASQPAAKRSKASEEPQKNAAAATAPPQRHTLFHCPDMAALFKGKWVSSGPRRIAPITLSLLTCFAYKHWERENHTTACAFSPHQVLEQCRAIATEHAVDPKKLLPDTMSEVLRTWGARMMAVSAISGGIVSQEVLKSITGRGIPLANIFVFDGASGKGLSERVGVSTTQQEMGGAEAPAKEAAPAMTVE
eukprot:TRINITY_DN8227_c0_g1_i2.p1 TRINITY_DN8227_c0_g1~~TRINITY_DN8227_c0_g1_i2.p1  ORF type:complete len:262 (-),score=50.52 TRINITY_DN8227_c0_g1_i2:91-876(-)